jgi:monoamine oxidase
MTRGAMEHTYINRPELLAIARSGFAERASRPVHVVVLGAGIAGLVAATELRQAGHKVTILEAQQRVGGRIRTLRAPFSNGQYAEAGAMRIPSKHRLVTSYIERYGLRMRPFAASNPRGWSYFNKHKCRLESALTNPKLFAFQLAAREQHKPFPELWGEVIDPIAADLANDSVATMARLHEQLQGVSLRDFLASLGWSDGAISMYGLFAGFETLLYASAFEFVREFVAGLRDDMVTIVGGMDQLPNAFLRDVGDRVQYGSVVTALDQDDDGVQVHVRGVGGKRVFRGDYAICTLPFSVLRHIEIEKAFSWQKQRAIRNLHYEGATKIFFECRERFWETRDGIYGGASVSDLAIRNTYYPEHGRDTGRGVLLGSYSHGQDAHRWGSLPAHERLVQALENIAAIHPEAPDLVDSGASVVWDQDEFAGGAYAFFQPHQEAQLHEHIVAPEGRYFFAGEHASLQHRWVQGAVESALVAARAIHGRTTQVCEVVRADGPAASSLEERLSEDLEERQSYAKDFGGVVHDVPACVLRPRSIEEVAEAVRYARARGLHVAARGVGHSAGGQSQVRDGLVIDMTSLDRLHYIDPARRHFVADAGIRWQQLMDVLVPLGWTPPVVTDWLHLTLGGTIIAGGVGAQSFKRGIQAGLIEELTIVTGTGEIITCSATENPDVFDASRGGLGQFGIIVRARMRIERAPREVTLDHLVYDDLESFVADVERLMASPSVDGLLAHAVGNTLELISHSTGVDLRASGLKESPSSNRWVYDLEVTRYHGLDPDEPGSLPADLRHVPALSHRQTWSFHDFIQRIPPIVERDQRKGAAPHPELALFVPHAQAASFIHAVLSETEVDDMGGGPVLIIPLAAATIDAPFFRIPDGERCWLFGLLRAADTPAKLARLSETNVRIYHDAIAIGSTRYPCDGVPAPGNREGWVAHYGPIWDRALALKDRLDPQRILAPKLGIFQSPVSTDG